MPEPNMTELRATVARLEEQISIERRKKRDRDAVHGDHASDADDRDAYHHDWAAFRKQAAEDAYRELPALLAAIKALLEDRERLDWLDDPEHGPDWEGAQALFLEGMANTFREAVDAGRAKESRDG